MNKLDYIAFGLAIFCTTFLAKILVSYFVDRKRTNFVLFWWACLIISVLLFIVSFLTK